MSDITPITLQDIFDTAWRHYILANEDPCGGSYCKYLGAENNSCAVGWALREHGVCDEDLAKMNGEGDIEHLSNRDAFRHYFADEIREAGLDDTDTTVANYLQQTLHDDLTEVGWVQLDDEEVVARREWKKRFRTQEARREHYIKVAKELGLTIPEDRTDG
jgi:hypothetical protein